MGFQPLLKSCSLEFTYKGSNMTSKAARKLCTPYHDSGSMLKTEQIQHSARFFVFWRA